MASHGPRALVVAIHNTDVRSNAIGVLDDSISEEATSQRMTLDVLPNRETGPSRSTLHSRSASFEMFVRLF